jgi:hypothetical protein
MGQLSPHYVRMETCQACAPLPKGMLIVLFFESTNLFQVVSDHHNELSNEQLATCTRVLPMLELLMSEWEDLLKDEDYEPVHHALKAGIALLEKYYRRADDTDAYFISHGTSSFHV